MAIQLPKAQLYMSLNHALQCKHACSYKTKHELFAYCMHVKLTSETTIIYASYLRVLLTNSIGTSRIHLVSTMYIHLRALWLNAHAEGRWYPRPNKLV